MTQRAQQAAPPEVRRSVEVPVGVDRAFELFTTRMSDFWPRAHSIGTTPMAAVEVEPEVGGRWFERGEDGTECPWGRVAAWEPPSRLVLVWQVSADWRYDPELETEVEIAFTATEVGCRVDLTHDLSAYGERAGDMHAVFATPNAWQATLGAFARVAGG